MLSLRARLRRAVRNQGTCISNEHILADPSKCIRTGGDFAGSAHELIGDLVTSIKTTAAIDATTALNELHTGSTLALQSLDRLGRRLVDKAERATRTQLDTIEDALSPEQRRIIGLLGSNLTYKQVANATKLKLKRVIKADLQAKIIADRIIDHDAAANFQATKPLD